MRETIWWASEDDLEGIDKNTIAIVKALWDIANILDKISNKLGDKK
jgi:hypothetical protein